MKTRGALHALRGSVRRRLVRSRGPRRWLPPGTTLDEFFDALRERGVDHVVLRWFEDLPHVDPGEDVDLLVADEHLAVVHDLLVRRQPLRETQKLDVYSASGLPGSDFGGIPYYPPRFSREVLATAVLQDGRYRVPDPEHHFDSLAYHAVYHKGRASGLAESSGTAASRQRSDHDYQAVLSRLAAATGLAVAPTLDDLDLHLARRGLRPPLDTLQRLLPRNPWLHDRFLADRPQVEDVWRGLAVFVLREQAASMVDAAVHELDREGFETLDVVVLTPAQREAAAHRLRGGNWERGPWPVSGGAPAVYLVCYDVAPRTADDDPHATNLRIPPAKEKVRRRLLADVAPEARFNPVHSSDDPGQALDYLEALGDAEASERLRKLAGALVESVRFPYPVLRLLPGLARRAQVAVVDHPLHGPTACKVFRPGAARFYERELRARTELADLPEVPVVLESRDSWLLGPLYDDDGSHVLRRLPGVEDVQLRDGAVRALARLAGDLHRRGLVLLDLTTQNLVTDPVAGLKVLDFEFLQDYPDGAPSDGRNWTAEGVPLAEARLDVPQRVWLTDGVPGRRGNAAFHPAVTGVDPLRLGAPGRPGEALLRAAVRWRWVARLARRRLRGAWRARVASSRVLRAARLAGRAGRAGGGAASRAVAARSASARGPGRGRG